MAYNALNNLIDAYIYANGVQAITGQILNGVLKQMVAQLGSGYHLMGAAGPETVPASNDYAMAYFAATAGEYTDFGGITIAAGEVAVLLTSGNGSWGKRTIYNVPTTTEDLENTAGFITNAVTDLVNYYTKTEVDTTLADYPTLEAMATALADYYTKTQIDEQKAVTDAALADRYTKSETDTKLADYYKKTETYDKDEVDSIVAALSRQEYIVAWDGLAAPDVSAIPAGVTVTYSGTTYTGTLAASAATIGKIYMVHNGTAYDMFATAKDSTYSWVPMGTTTVDLSQYATKAELNQLQQEINALEVFEEKTQGVQSDIPIDLSSYPKTNGIIAGTTWDAITSGYQHIVIPVSPKRVYRIKAGTTNAVYAFLKSYSAPIAGVTPNFADGCTLVNVPSGIETSAFTPNDAKFLYILATVSGVNRLPILFYIPAFKGTISKLEDSIKGISSVVDYSTLSVPEYRLGHIAPNGAISSGSNVVFTQHCVALKGSRIWVEPGYKYQYALFDINTWQFIERVTWKLYPDETVLDDDYFILVEIATDPESEVSDTSISEHLHCVLYYNIDNAQTRIEALDEAVLSKDYNLSSYLEINGIIAGSTWDAIVSGYGHIVVPVSPGRAYRIKAGTASTSFAFLKTYSAPVSGESPDFASGYEKTINISANNEVEVVAPSNATYLYLLAKTDGNDRLPASLQGVSDIDTNIKNSIGAFADSLTPEYLQLTEQADNIISAIGFEPFKNKTLKIVPPEKYSCWPFIGTHGEILVCLYTFGIDHETTPSGSVCVKFSKNGIIWTPKKEIINTDGNKDSVTGRGNDTVGNLIFWNRVGMPGSSGTFYEMYRMEDDLSFTKISTPSFSQDTNPCGIIVVPTIGLMSFYHTYGTTRGWGKVVSADNGVTWEQVPIETGLSIADCPVEISAAYLGDGKIIALGRYDAADGNTAMWQLQSSDYGATWTRQATNIYGYGNTASIVYNTNTDEISVFYYRRSPGKLEYRKATVSQVWDSPTAWPDAEVIASGETGQDAGNVNAVIFGGNQFAAFYSGNSSKTGIFEVIK